MLVNGFEINGPILWKWRSLGMEDAAVGLPVSRQQGNSHADLSKFAFQYFERGIIVMVELADGRGEPFAIWGDIYKRWVEIGGFDFGLPITDELPMPDGLGRYNEFAAWDSQRTKNLIVWSASNKAWEIVFDFRQRWEQASGAGGPLGYPTGAREDFEGGRTQAFVGGALTWHQAIGAFMLSGQVGICYNALGRHHFGYPTAAAADISPSLTLVHLARGANPTNATASIVWTSDLGAHGLSGEIRKYWMAYGFIEIPPYLVNPYGYPAAEAVIAEDGIGISQRFASGEIVWHPDLVQPFGIHDPIALKWRELGGPAAGYPWIEQFKRLDKAVLTHFRKMHLPERPDWTIIHHEKTGPHPLYEPIRGKFALIGWEAWNVLNSQIPDEYGLPLDDEGSVFDEIGRAQSFQKGTMCLHPELGPFFIRGPAEPVWMQLGRENWGYPTIDRKRCSDGIGYYQHFRAMHLPGTPDVSIYWSTTTDPFPVVGEIRRRWAQRGWEGSNLGYPTSTEYPDNSIPHLVLAQNFQFGRILVFDDIGAIFDPLTFSMPMESGGLAAFGGEMNVAIYADCTVRWHGHARSSGLDSYAYSASASVSAAPGSQVVFAFSQHGNVYGTLTPGDRQDDWDERSPAPLLFRNMLPGFYDVSLKGESDYASGIAGTLKDVVGFVVKFYIGAAATMVGGGLGLGLILIGTAGAAAVGEITGGSWRGGLRLAGGILWMAGPANTLVALGAQGLAHIGANEAELPANIYDWANEEVFAYTLPPRESILLTDTTGAGNRPFVFPRMDGKLTLNLKVDQFLMAVNLPRWHGENVSMPELAATLIHELVHCCQAARWGHQRYLSSALGIAYFQVTGNPYLYELGSTFRSYNLEQQGHIVEDWFLGDISNGFQRMDPNSPLYPLIVQMRAREY